MVRASPSPSEASDDEEDFDLRREFKEGQTKPTPPNGDATRGFYQSLLDENCYSPMAIKYCVEYGCLNGKALTKTLQNYQRIKEMQGFSTDLKLKRQFAEQWKKEVEKKKPKGEPPAKKARTDGTPDGPGSAKGTPKSAKK
jgi:hypothetical protein